MNNLSKVCGLFVVLLFSCSASRELQRSQSENSELRLRLDTLRQRLEYLDSQLVAFDHTKIQLRKTENALIQFYQKYEGAVPEKGILDIDPSLKKSNRSYGEVNAQNEILQDQLRKLAFSYDSLLRIRSAPKQPSSKNTTSKLLAEQQRKSALLEKENVELKDNHKELLKRYDQSVNEQKQLLVEFKKINKELEVTQNNRKELQSELIQLQQANGRSSERSKGQLDELKSENEQLRTNNQFQQNEISRIQSELEHLRAQLKQKEEDLKNIQENARLHQNQDATELAESKIENEQLKNQNNLLLQKLEYLNRLLADKSAELAEATSSKELQSKVQAQEAELDDRAQVIRSLNGFIDSKNAEIQALNDSLLSHQNTLSQIRDHLEELEKQNMLLQSKNNLDASRQKNEMEMTLQLERLKNEKREQNEAIQKMRSELENADKERAQLKRELSSERDELSNVRADLENLKRGRAEQNAIKLFQDSLMNFRNQNETLLKKLSQAQTESDSIRASGSVLIKKNAFLYKQLETAEAETIQLKNKLSASHSPQNKLQKSKEMHLIDLEKLNTKCKDILQNYAAKRCTSFVREGRMFIYLPHHILFTPDSYVMTTEGSNIMSKLALVLKNEPNMVFEISGYTQKVKEGNLSVDLMIRNASTVFKLLSALGLDANHMKLGAKFLTDDFKTAISPNGIELQFHAN